MSSAKSVSSLPILALMVIACLLVACEQGAVKFPPETTSLPTLHRTLVPMSPPPVSRAAPVPTATSPSASPTMTPVPISWNGPLLYPSWEQGERSIPVFDLGTQQAYRLLTDALVDGVLDWSPDGCHLAYRSAEPDGLVHLLDVATQEDHALDIHGATALRWSPDGEWIAYSAGSQVYVARSDGTDARQLTHNSFAKYLRGWAVDGQNVLYWAFHVSYSPEAYEDAGSYTLASFDIGTGTERQVARYSQPLEQWGDLAITDVNSLRPGFVQMPGKPTAVRYVDMVWTPDFRYWAIITAEGLFEWGYIGVNLYWLDLAESQVITVGTNMQGSFSFSLSRDGTRVAFVAYQLDQYSSDRARTYVLNMETGQVEVVGQDALWLPHWSPDATMLSYQGPLPESPTGSSFVYTLDTGETLRLPGDFYRDRWGLDWSPRGTYRAGACSKDPGDE